MMRTQRSLRLGLALAGILLSQPAAHAQLSPPPGNLAAPRAAAPARPSAAPAPVPAPRAPVQQVAPMASPVLRPPPAVAPPSALGRAAPKPPVVAPRPNAGAQRPPAAKPAAPKPATPAAPPPRAGVPAGVAAGVAAGAVAGAAAGAAAAGAARPADPKPAAAPPPPPPEEKPAEPAKGSVTGQPLPRWAGILYDGVKLRVGPGARYPVEWVYRRPDQPVRILREFETWRLVEDHEGVRGWVHQSNLTGRRSFMVPAERTLRRSASEDAGPVAILKPGVVGRVRACAATAAWCEVRVADHRGWLRRDGLWGLSPGEQIGN